MGKYLKTFDWVSAKTWNFPVSLHMPSAYCGSRRPLGLSTHCPLCLSVFLRSAPASQALAQRFLYYILTANPHVEAQAHPRERNSLLSTADSEAALAASESKKGNSGEGRRPRIGASSAHRISNPGPSSCTFIVAEAFQGHGMKHDWRKVDSVTGWRLYYVFSYVWKEKNCPL